MHTKRAVTIAAMVSLLGTMLFLTVQPQLGAQSGAVALAGEVSSQAEGKMEGVAIVAEREGTAFRVSVYSDAGGQYSFPRTHLAPGTYTLTIRAAGYDLVPPGPITVSEAKPASVNLTLTPTKDLTRQLTSREWVLSMPGPDEIKNKLVGASVSCTYCHSLERVVKSKHNAEQWIPVLHRMHTFFTDGTAAPQGTGRARTQLEPEPRRSALEKAPDWWPYGSVPVPKAELAQFLEGVNLSGGRTQFPYTLKPLPRAKGPATRIIVTTWDVPRKNATYHDSDVDSKGRIWFTSENDDIVAMLDPKTNTFAEFPLPRVEPNAEPGARDTIIDKADNVWLPLRLKAGGHALYKFNTTTHQISRVDGSGFGAYGDGDPDGSHVWLSFVRVNAETAKVDGDFRKPATGPRPTGYGFVVNSKGNPYGTDIFGSIVHGVDVAMNEGKAWPTPSPNRQPRRGRMDAQDRFWMGFYGTGGIGMFDTRTEKWSEWQIPGKFMTPYTATVPDRRGYVYTPSHTAEAVIRLDPKTGEFIEYPMPTAPGNFDTKKMAFDPTASTTTLLFANTRNAQIMRVEFLD